MRRQFFERGYFPMLILQKHTRPHSVSDYLSLSNEGFVCSFVCSSFLNTHGQLDDQYLYVRGLQECFCGGFFSQFMHCKPVAGGKMSDISFTLLPQTPIVMLDCKVVCFFLHQRLFMDSSVSGVLHQCQLHRQRPVWLLCHCATQGH